MIQVLVVDDHPAIRAGLLALLRAEPGIVPVGACETPGEALALAATRRVDVALVDFHLPEMNGVSLARELRRRPTPPRVVMYSADGDERLTLAAQLVGITCVLSKSSGAEVLYDAIRRAAADDAPDNGVASAAPTLHALRDEIDLEDLPLVGMACDGTDVADMAEVLGLETTEVEASLERIADSLASRQGSMSPRRIA
jgi:DNA-binding NarL/FixJ family response regulator